MVLVLSNREEKPYGETSMPELLADELESFHHTGSNTNIDSIQSHHTVIG